jgi:hypothetical protein
MIHAADDAMSGWESAGMADVSRDTGHATDMRVTVPVAMRCVETVRLPVSRESSCVQATMDWWRTFDLDLFDLDLLSAVAQ